MSLGNKCIYRGDDPRVILNDSALYSVFHEFHYNADRHSDRAHFFDMSIPFVRELLGTLPTSIFRGEAYTFELYPSR